MLIDAKSLDGAQFPHLLGRIDELFEKAIILGDGPDHLASIDIGVVPLQEVFRRCNVLRDGLLR